MKTITKQFTMTSNITPTKIYNDGWDSYSDTEENQSFLHSIPKLKTKKESKSKKITPQTEWKEPEKIPSLDPKSGSNVFKVKQPVVFITEKNFPSLDTQQVCQKNIDSQSSHHHSVPDRAENKIQSKKISYSQRIDWTYQEEENKIDENKSIRNFNNSTFKKQETRIFRNSEFKSSGSVNEKTDILNSKEVKQATTIQRNMNFLSIKDEKNKFISSSESSAKKNIEISTSNQIEQTTKIQRNMNFLSIKDEKNKFTISSEGSANEKNETSTSKDAKKSTKIQRNMNFLSIKDEKNNFIPSREEPAKFSNNKSYIKQI